MSSQSDHVKSAIIERIRSGELRAGDPIDVEALKTAFGVSGTPVRDAVNQLEAVGLVERTPRSGVRVFEPNMQRLLGLIEVYAELEGICARVAAKRITPDQAERLERATAACEAYVASPRSGRDADYYPLNMEFHLAILSATSNPDLQELLYNSATRLITFLRARHLLPGEPERTAQEHRQIAEAILGGEPERARALTIAHVQIDGTTIFDTLQMMKRI